MPVPRWRSGHRRMSAPVPPCRIWVSERREVGARPDRRALAPEASSSVMTKTPFDSRDGRGPVHPEPKLTELVDERPYPLGPALDHWRAIVDGPPRIAREQFGWQRLEAAPVATDAIVGSGSWA